MSKTIPVPKDETFQQTLDFCARACPQRPLPVTYGTQIMLTASYLDAVPSNYPFGSDEWNDIVRRCFDLKLAVHDAVQFIFSGQH